MWKMADIVNTAPKSVENTCTRERNGRNSRERADRTLGKRHAQSAVRIRIGAASAARHRIFPVPANKSRTLGIARLH